jgi:hypothetical protein
MAEEDYHQCHFCGEYVKDGKDIKGERHYLSDCRPDLVEHEIGETCTWAFRRNPNLFPAERLIENQTCYAYQNLETLEWTNEHVHFYKDGPM